jgi:hypothetical protein
MDEMQTHGGHTLPTIPHFHQRPELDRLREVWRDEPWQRLIVLSAPPGSGKTALLSRFLEELPGSGVNRAGIEKRNDLPAPRGVFVWSVHLDRDVDQFLVRFHDYLVGEALPSNRRYAATSRLIQALEAERITPTLLVLDGVEILHESWEPWWITAHSDHRLCHILRRAAVGTIGLRVLLTSTGWSSGQFGLTYDDYVLLGGTRALRLDEELGCSILRDRGLRGSDDQLPDLVERLLPAQALELDHLGMLASGFHDGTLDRFSEESRHRLLDIADREGRTIIGAMYQHHMPPQELALLQILSAFRHPLRATMMEDFLSATLEEVEKQLALPSDRPRKGARDAESLAACARSYESIKCSLPDLLVALRERNLVEVYTDEGQIYYGPHPVVRHDAYQSLGSDAVTLHQQIANYVDYRPPPWVLAEELAPNDVEALHRMEASFHHGLRSPHGSLATAAFSSHRLGRSAYELLGWRPAAYERGARLLAPALTRETSVRRRDLDFQPAQRFIFGHGSYFHDLSLWARRMHVWQRTI